MIRSEEPAEYQGIAGAKKGVNFAAYDLSATEGSIGDSPFDKFLRDTREGFHHLMKSPRQATREVPERKRIRQRKLVAFFGISV
ncbi:MAG TPA: hypothetical protein VJ550_07345 [Geomonas sp.]|nr:hypothetical protein [Geomonas sp.]